MEGMLTLRVRGGKILPPAPGRSGPGERGSVAPMVLGLMVVLLTIGLGILNLSLRQSQNVVDDGKRQTAVSLAEGGIDHVLWRLRQTPDAQNHYGPDWRSLADERDVALSGGTYYLGGLETDTNGRVKGVRMQGWVPDRATPGAVSAEIYVELNPKAKPLFGAALLADQRLTLNGNPTVDSYKSSAGAYASAPKYQNGDVAVNNPAAHSITINGNASLKGHVYYPPSGSASTVLMNGNGTPTGGILPNPADTRFQPIPAVPSDAVYLKPVTANGNSDVAFVTVSNVTLPPPLSSGKYVVTKDTSGNSITLNGNSKLRLAGTAQTLLYLEGNATLNGNGIVNAGNRPTSLQIYGMPMCQRITYNGNTDFYGAIYAPQADVTLNGNCKYLGSVVGGTITGNGNITVHYDEDLGMIGGGVAGYSLASWTQLR